ncbi:MAG: rhomboid family intramembrane serine protease [Propionibacteriales bacterium]|nr:rhomboid family intramembrane serine protease [Propionibacteriales bacterium]
MAHWFNAGGSRRQVMSRRERSQVWQSAVVNGLLVAAMWVLELVDTALGGALDLLGIRPRDPDSLASILVAPWLHVDWQHLISNSVPFFLLGFFILGDSWREWLTAIAAAILASGLAVWLFSAPGSLTIGASGIVFGWFGYLGLRGFLSRNTQQIVISVLVLILYGGMLAGLLPGQAGISWQGHLGGLAGGLAAAWWLHRRSRRRLTARAAPRNW